MKDNVINYKFFNWGPFLYQSSLTKEEIKKVKLLCKKDEKKDYRKNLAGLLKQEYSIDKDKLFPILSAYFNSYVKASIEHYQIKVDAKELILESAWVNYMSKFEINPLHVHTEDLSFVLFLKVPKNLMEEVNKTVSHNSRPGSVNFINELKNNNFHIIEHSFMPTVGDLFIFPSTLHHYVNSFKSNGERVSVSGNLILK